MPGISARKNTKSCNWGGIYVHTNDRSFTEKKKYLMPNSLRSVYRSMVYARWSLVQSTVMLELKHRKVILVSAVLWGFFCHILKVFRWPKSLWQWMIMNIMIHVMTWLSFTLQEPVLLCLQTKHMHSPDTEIVN